MTTQQMHRFSVNGQWTGCNNSKPHPPHIVGSHAQAQSYAPDVFHFCRGVEGETPEGVLRIIPWYNGSENFRGVWWIEPESDHHSLPPLPVIFHDEGGRREKVTALIAVTSRKINERAMKKSIAKQHNISIADISCCVEQKDGMFQVGFAVYPGDLARYPMFSDPDPRDVMRSVASYLGQ